MPSSSVWKRKEVAVLLSTKTRAVNTTVQLRTYQQVDGHEAYEKPEAERYQQRQLKTWPKRQGLEIGVFCALHTYSRKLNWNCHVHVSATRGGICQRTGLWKPIYFKAKVTEACWRAAITQLLSAHYSELDLSAGDCPFIRHEKDWFAFLHSQYHRRWTLHFGKKMDQQHKTVNYLGRYLKT